MSTSALGQSAQSWRSARLTRAGSSGTLPAAGMAVQTPKGVVRLEDLCRPRRSRANVKTNGRAFHKPFEVAYREIAELRNFRRLEHLFIAADVDRSGEMSLDEFRQALRKPWFQRSFSLLGVQPHQAEVVFKKMNTANAEEISISDFMQGLESLLGTDLDGPPRDLDVSLLSSRFKAKTKLTSSRSEPALVDVPTDFRSLPERDHAGARCNMGLVTVAHRGLYAQAPETNAKRKEGTPSPFYDDKDEYLQEGPRKTSAEAMTFDAHEISTLNKMPGACDDPLEKNTPDWDHLRPAKYRERGSERPAEPTGTPPRQTRAREREPSQVSESAGIERNRRTRAEWREHRRVGQRMGTEHGYVYYTGEDRAEDFMNTEICSS
ncbi:unnamed protein product [Symbiodinium sp. CCMP2592]|nr:unnamed protein product [Symbiodinium sp. CCMP2592]